MRCMTNYARRGSRPAAALRLGEPLGRRRQPQVGRHPPLRQFSHEACGRDFTYWIKRFGYLERLLAGRREHRLGQRHARHACARSSSPGCTPPGHRENILGPYARSASACGSAASKATPAPTSGPRIRRAADAAERYGAPQAPRMRACPTPSTSATATRFLATELTRGPGTPAPSTPGRRRRCSARELERLPEDAAEFQVGRVTFEILRSVPIGAGRGRGAGRAPRAAGCSCSRPSCATTAASR